MKGERKMGCYYHEGVEDVAICPQCGKKLCRGCASVTVEGICYNCAIQNNLKVKNTFFIDLALSIILCSKALSLTLKIFFAIVVLPSPIS